MAEKNIALIVGATGLSGSYTARELKSHGWTVVTVSRSDVDLEWSDRHIAADLADAEGSDTEMYGRYFHAMQEQGVYIAPSQFEAGFVSMAHMEADIDATIAKAEAALSTLR